MPATSQKTASSPTDKAVILKTVNVYTPKVDDAIWALTRDGWKPGQIRHALEHDHDLIDELGGPIQMPPRTLSEKLRRLKEDRGEPTPIDIAPGEELDVVRTLRREMLSCAQKQLRKLLEVEELSTQQIQVMGGLMKLVNSTEAALREGARVKDPQRQDAARQRHNSPRIDILREIAKAEEAKVQDEAE